MQIKQGFTEFRPPFPVNTRINHMLYGEGTTVGWEGSDADPRLVVEFDRDKDVKVAEARGYPFEPRILLYSFERTRFDVIG